MTDHPNNSRVLMQRVILSSLLIFAVLSYGQDITISISELSCLNARDGESVSEPYIWPVFFVIDDDAVINVLCRMHGNRESIPAELEFLGLEGTICAERDADMLNKWLRMTNGSHGNVGVNNFSVGQTHPIPNNGVTTFSFNNTLTSNNARVGLIVVLLEEDFTPPDADIDRAYGTFYGTIRERLKDLLRSSLRRFGSGVGSRPRGQPRPAAMNPFNTQRVVFYDSDFHLRVAEMNRGRWETTDLTRQLPQLALGNWSTRTPYAPQPYIKPSDGTFHMSLVHGGNILDVWRETSSNTWRVTNIGALVRVPNVPNSVPFSWGQGPFQYIIFRGPGWGPDGRGPVRDTIHYISSTAPDRWAFEDFSKTELRNLTVLVD